MATMITNECINCGACEPECPNNAISQGDPVYVIDPLLCTECVGFHDYEACAAVCPVDCCVTDPNNIETEEALIARARKLHPESQIGDNFESRFRKGEGNAGAPAPQKQAAPQASSATPKAMAASTAGAPALAPTTAVVDSDVNYVQLPEIDSWTIPLRCIKCNETQVVPVGHFMIGNVIFCPHCHKSVVVRDNLNFHVRTLLKDAYFQWEKEQNEFAARRERELTEFRKSRANEADAFETRQKRALEKIRQDLDAIGETYDAPGRPLKRGARFAWG